MNCTVDASVFVAASRTVEAQHDRSYAFLRRAQALSVSILCPNLALPESAAAIARPTGDEALAEHTVGWIQDLPGLRLVSVDLPLALSAARIATVQRLRGADSVYVAVAQAFNATLVTWDDEMLERAAPAAEAMTPTQWMEQQGAGA